MKATPCGHGVQAEQKQCVQLADSTTSIDYQLALATSGPAGPGQVIVVLENTSFQSSTYLHLSGIAFKLDIYLSKQQLLHTNDFLSATSLKLAADQPESRPLFTVPSPLLHGAAIQLRKFLSGQFTDLPYYAVSEELLDSIFLSASFKKVPSQTPYDASLPAKAGFQTADMLLCPASHYRSSRQYQQDGHRRLPKTQASLLSAPLEQHREAHFAWFPWGVNLCLLLCIIALLVNKRQQAAWQAAAQHDKSAAQTAADHEPSFVKSNWPVLDPTPTKDTGSSPFVPVSHFQAPVPHWPVDTAHLASCSSKIGSYKQKARPATSRAVTNMTSNVSGATKWQRNKNGRLLSLALNPDEHNS